MQLSPTAALRANKVDTSREIFGNYFRVCFSNPRKNESDPFGAMTSLRANQKRRNKTK